MNQRLPTVAATLLAALCLTPPHAAAASGIGAAHGFAADQLLVKFSGGPARSIELPPQVGVHEAAAALRDSPRVAYAAPNYVATASEAPEEPAATIPNDPGPIT